MYEVLTRRVHSMFRLRTMFPKALSMDGNLKTRTPSRTVGLTGTATATALAGSPPAPGRLGLGVRVYYYIRTTRTRRGLPLALALHSGWQCHWQPVCQWLTGRGQLKYFQYNSNDPPVTASGPTRGAASGRLGVTASVSSCCSLRLRLDASGRLSDST